MIRARFELRLPELLVATDFSVPERGTTVLWGESGSGKTTILNCIAGLRRPDSGVIEIHDRIVFSSAACLDEAPQARGVGFVFQHYALFPHLSALDNVALALTRRSRGSSAAPGIVRPGEARRMALPWLERFGIAQLAKRRPASLSGGERQRLAFARALAVEPRVLLLDEPFSALDRKSKEVMHEEFRNLRRELTMSVILVSHDRTEAEYLGERILEVRDGLAVEAH